MTRTRNVFGAAALLLLTACPLPKELREVPAPPVAADLLVSVAQLQRRLNDPATVILHVGRDRASYDAGHIPGARYLALSSIDSDGAVPSVQALDDAFEAVGVSDASHVVVYGDLGGLAAGRAFFALDYLGHPPAVLDGGLQAWRAAGRPVETAAATASRGTFTPRPHPELVVDAAWVRGHMRDSTVAIIDARPPEQSSGAEPGEGVQRPGHIPGAKNLFWQNTVASPANPVLRSPEVLRALYRLAGGRFATDVEFVRERPRYEPADTSQAARRGRRPQQQRRPPRTTQAPPRPNTVVVYGRTGVEASWDYFVARYLGYQTKLYDAGFIDWSRRGTDYPVER
ncbi:3-mercaptopyruvate sulfurtransferase SseA, contains two rhodanese domains [bacterium JGI 053]|nr:3-mercaptopyruvate sulfurtransferase SseA, contains two rhodanese domains [bacterium JGI 053]